MKVNDSVAFSTSMILYNHLFRNFSITPKGDPISRHSPVSLPQPLATTSLLSLWNLICLFWTFYIKCWEGRFRTSTILPQQLDVS